VKVSVKYHEEKMSSGKKFLHKKSETTDFFSPISNLQDLQVSDFKLPKQSGNKDKRSPNKENVQVPRKEADFTSIPVSVGKRRGRNDRSAVRAEKSTKKLQTQEAPFTAQPFTAQDTNSPMKLRIRLEETTSAKSNRS